MTKEVEMLLVPFGKGPDDPRRASEGSAVELNDGRIFYAYSHFSQSGHDCDVSEMRAMISEDSEGTKWGKPYVIVPNEGRLNTMIACLARLGTQGKRLMRTLEKETPDDILKGTEGGPIGFVYLKQDTIRDTSWCFRLSRDEGRSWSAEQRINDPMTGGGFKNDVLMVLSNGRIIMPGGWGHGGLGVSFLYYSDDEGYTWFRSEDEICIRQKALREDGKPGHPVSFTHFSEFNLVELKDGRLMGIGRNLTGRIWKTYSHDLGDTWSDPVPMELASSLSPATVKRIPSTGDLLMIWNQVTAEEIKLLWSRCRLSCAISKDEGETWEHFKNLESLDDTTRIEPEDMGDQFDVGRVASRHQAMFDGRQPLDPKKYPRLNEGYGHIDYQSLCFTRDNRAVITYFVGADKPLEEVGMKLRILPVEWFYGEGIP